MDYRSDEARFRDIAMQMRWFLCAVYTVEYEYDDEVPKGSKMDIAWGRMTDYYVGGRNWWQSAWDLQRAMRHVFGQILSDVEEGTVDAYEMSGWLGVPVERIKLLFTACLDLPVQDRERVQRLLGTFMRSWELAWGSELDMDIDEEE